MNFHVYFQITLANEPETTNSTNELAAGGMTALDVKFIACLLEEFFRAVLTFKLRLSAVRVFMKLTFVRADKPLLAELTLMWSLVSVHPHHVNPVTFLVLKHFIAFVTFERSFICAFSRLARLPLCRAVGFFC